MSFVFVIILSLGVAACLSWLVRRQDLRRELAPTPCARIVDTVFAGGAKDIEDSVLLKQLLQHSRECISDPAFSEQVRHLLVNTQQVDEARAFLERARKAGAFTPDEFSAQVAWVDLAAAHTAWSSGDEVAAEQHRANAITTAELLRGKWPEWTVPYLLLDEANQIAGHSSATGAPTHYFQDGQQVRRRLATGALLRDFSTTEAMAWAFVMVGMGMLGLSAAVSGFLDQRQLQRLPPTSIAAAKPGYVALEGTLHLAPGTVGVIGPHSRQSGVWYELERQSGMKGSRSTFERAAQPFILRDATGETLIDPRNMQVRTRHSVIKLDTGGFSSTRRVAEEMLKEGDAVYVVGEMTTAPAAKGMPTRIMRAADDGRRLLVSNFGKDRVLTEERAWFWVGVVVFVLATLASIWCYYQRYRVINEPSRQAATQNVEG